MEVQLNKASKYLLALDQSTAVTGWALYENGKLVNYGKYDPSGEIIERLVKLRKWIDEEFISQSTGNLTIAIEAIQLQKIPGSNENQNVETFRKLALVQGALLTLFEEKKIHCEVVSASSWKSLLKIKGKNRAEQKQDAQRYVLEKFNIKAIQDTVDAICIGEYSLNKPKETAW